MDENNCSICLDNYSPDKKEIMLDCNHKFHFDCLFMWTLKNNTCPYCRAVISNNYFCKFKFKSLLCNVYLIKITYTSIIFYNTNHSNYYKEFNHLNNYLDIKSKYIYFINYVRIKTIYYKRSYCKLHLFTGKTGFCKNQIITKKIYFNDNQSCYNFFKLVSTKMKTYHESLFYQI